MAGSDKIGIVMATMIEARPFIEKMCLELKSNKPFPVYNKENFFLIISGIGKACSASAVTHMINLHDVNILFNPGAAGSLNEKFQIGDILHINKIFEPDRPYISGGKRFLVPDIMDGFPAASLSTQDRPMVTDSDRDAAGKDADLADMEGASFIQICRLYKKKGYLFKIVTDVPGNDSNKDIIKSVKDTAVILCDFFKDKIFI
jgi:adenosylhomocysteine nucleosidase